MGERPRFQGMYAPLDQFRGWLQLGVAMIGKQKIRNNPPLKARDLRPTNMVAEVSIETLPANCLNVVVELLHRDQRALLEVPEVQPPVDAKLHVFELSDLLIVLTVLGHEQNLLIRPAVGGVLVSHFNSRYSANASGVQYVFEAYALSESEDRKS